MLCCVVLCYVVLCYIVLCYVVLCYVVLYCVMLCYVMFLCYVRLGYVNHLFRQITKKSALEPAGNMFQFVKQTPKFCMNVSMFILNL